jgi:hypothetical protein
VIRSNFSTKENDQSHHLQGRWREGSTTPASSWTKPSPAAPEARRSGSSWRHFNPSWVRNEHGKTEIWLHVPSSDLWLAILTIMASLKNLWCEPRAIQ